MTVTFSFRISPPMVMTALEVNCLNSDSESPTIGCVNLGKLLYSVLQSTYLKKCG